MCVRPSVTICWSLGEQTFLAQWREAGTNFFQTQGGGDKHFYIEGGGQTFLHRGGGNKHFMLEAVVPMMMLMKRWL